jgi:TRAP-type C4-dicarboxylate transport system permease small subunit
MKTLAYILFLLSTGLFVDASIEQFSGHAKAYSPIRNITLIDIYREKQPSEFKGIMAYQWIRVSLIAGAGYIFLSLGRRADSLDPFAPK